jgi:predicted nicotinamide N-methyase
VKRETITLPTGAVELLVPDDPEALLDEQAFEREDEFIPYWAELWPSALALAAHVSLQDLSGARVLELGCGVGLVAIAAARRGARVHATDWSADAVALTLDNAHRNGVVLDAGRADWFRPESLPAGPFDLVLAADVLYERRNAQPLAELIPQLAPQAWIADPGRAYAQDFLDAVAPAMQRDDADLGDGIRLYGLRA